MKIEDALAAVRADANEAVRLHQGVVGTVTAGQLPYVTIGDASLQMPAIGTVKTGDVVQVLSAGSRWVILGTVTAGSAPNLVPNDGWAWDRPGTAACSIQVPETQFAISADYAAADVNATEGMVVGQFHCLDGYRSFKHQIGTNFCDAVYRRDPVANNHWGFKLGPYAGGSNPYDFYTAGGNPIDTTSTSTIRMFAAGRTLASTSPDVYFTMGWTSGGPKLQVRGPYISAEYVSKINTSNYIRASITTGLYSEATWVVESELKPDGSVRLWQNGVLLSPTITKNPAGGPALPMYQFGLSEPIISLPNASSEVWVYEWIVDVAMDEDARAAKHAELCAKYLPIN
jgi:hypothetical protein